MELFYGTDTGDGTCLLNEEESRHCVKVLRHRTGDIVHAIDGAGTLLECRIAAIGKEVRLEILSRQPDFGGRPYRLRMAVAPTKNIDRYEWFLEKGTELGMDEVVPLIGEHSERRNLKPERLEKILISAAKQSLKGKIPVLREAVGVKEFLSELSGNISGNIRAGESGPAESAAGNAASSPAGGRAGGGRDGNAPAHDAGCSRLRLIAYCGAADKRSLPQALEEFLGERGCPETGSGRTAGEEHPQIGGVPEITVLIGPEGDFSEEEVRLAREAGFVPIHLGTSRLRTETAAVTAVAGVYFSFQ